MSNGYLEEERIFVCYVRLTRDPHDPEVDGVWVVCLTVVFLELWGYEPDIIVVVRWYQDVWWKLQCLWILSHDLCAPRAWYQGHYRQFCHRVEVHRPITVEPHTRYHLLCAGMQWCVCYVFMILTLNYETTLNVISKEDVPTWCKQFYYDFFS